MYVKSLRQITSTKLDVCIPFNNNSDEQPYINICSYAILPVFVWTVHYTDNIAAL